MGIVRVRMDENGILWNEDGTRHEMPETDWERLKAMTDEEITRIALEDPDCPPLTEEQMKNAVRMCDLPGETLIEKLRNMHEMIAREAPEKGEDA